MPPVEAAVRQTLVGDTPVVETRVRVVGGDIVHHAYAVDGSRWGAGPGRRDHQRDTRPRRHRPGGRRRRPPTVDGEVLSVGGPPGPAAPGAERVGGAGRLPAPAPQGDAAGGAGPGRPPTLPRCPTPSRSPPAGGPRATSGPAGPCPSRPSPRPPTRPGASSWCTTHPTWPPRPGWPRPATSSASATSRAPGPASSPASALSGRIRRRVTGSEASTGQALVALGSVPDPELVGAGGQGGPLPSSGSAGSAAPQGPPAGRACCPLGRSRSFLGGEAQTYLDDWWAVAGLVRAARLLEADGQLEASVDAWRFARGLAADVDRSVAAVWPRRPPRAGSDRRSIPAGPGRAAGRRGRRGRRGRGAGGGRPGGARGGRHARPRPGRADDGDGRRDRRGALRRAGRRG